MGDPTTIAEDLALQLAKAIQLGDKETSAACAGHLAELCVPVTVQLKQEAYPKQEIGLRVSVEDAQLLTAHITLRVRADMTISSLKDLVFKDYGFHPRVQQWVVGQRLPQDRETLHYLGIRKEGDMAFLYIRSAKQAKLSPAQLERAQRCLIEEVILEPRGSADLSTDVAEIKDLAEEVKTPPRLEIPAPPAPPKVGWACLECTYINQPTRPGCKMCCRERPVGYTVPDIYEPDEEEQERLRKEEAAVKQYEQQERERTEEIIQALLLQQLGFLETDAASAAAAAADLGAAEPGGAP